jgi:hypothetical protein
MAISAIGMLAPSHPGGAGVKWIRAHRCLRCHRWYHRIAPSPSCRLFGGGGDHTSYCIRHVIMCTTRVIDAVPATTRRPALKRYQLMHHPIMVEQINAPSIQ